MKAEKIHTFSEIFGKVSKLPKSLKKKQNALENPKPTQIALKNILKRSKEKKTRKNGKSLNKLKKLEKQENT